MSYDPSPYAEPSAARWLSYTHLPSGHSVSTVILDHDDPALARDFGTSVMEPNGSWAEVKRYTNEDDAIDGHVRTVERLVEERHESF